MSRSRGKHRQSSASVSSAAIRPQVERMLQKGEFKEAVKQAKLAFRDDPSQDNRQLLERAYLERIEHLARSAMPEVAKEVALQLLDFGLSDQRQLPRLLMLLPEIGLPDRAAQLSGQCDSPEIQSELMDKLADRAVLHPDRVAEPDLAAGALCVRGALEKLDAGDEAAALDCLRDIARGSPLADWRYLVRGWAAYRRGDWEQARANWERLNPHRAAHRIARALQDLAAAGNVQADLSMLEARVFGGPILPFVDRLRTHVAQGLWPDAIRQLGPLRANLRRVDPRLAQRLTAILLPSLIESTFAMPFESAERLIGNFTAAAEPLELDPHWNRLWALVYRHVDGAFDDVTQYWRRYLDDVEHMPGLPPEQRKRIQALVWKHLASEILDQLPPPAPPGLPSYETAADKKARRQAADYLEKCLAADATIREGHELLLRCHREANKPAQARDAARRLVAAFPNDVETLTFLIEDANQRENFEEMLAWSRQARLARPLDDDLRNCEFRARLSLAREHAVRDRFDAAADMLAQAEPLAKDAEERQVVRVRRAALAWKSGQAAEAERLAEEARQQPETDAAALWLSLAIECLRYETAMEVDARYRERWRAELAQPVRAETAGAMARLMGSYLAANITFLHRDDYAREVVKYIKKAVKLDHSRQSLQDICAFLHVAPKQATLLGQFLRKAIKAFPDVPKFLLFDIERETAKGPHRADLSLIAKQTKKALKLAEASHDPEVRKLVEPLRQQQAILAELRTAARHMPPGFPLGGGDFAQDIVNLLDQFVGGESDDELDLPPPPRRRKRR